MLDLERVFSGEKGPLPSSIVGDEPLIHEAARFASRLDINRLLS
ncbi:MAG: hypothetical protein OXD44_09050 [Gammaproteobacteria bacterium]|nr:hypothetical protein [Gammaproteobacteria bacterium]